MTRSKPTNRLLFITAIVALLATPNIAQRNTPQFSGGNSQTGSSGSSSQFSASDIFSNLPSSQSGNQAASQSSQSSANDVSSQLLAQLQSLQASNSFGVSTLPGAQAAAAAAAANSASGSQTGSSLATSSSQQSGSGSSGSQQSNQQPRSPLVVSRPSLSSSLSSSSSQQAQQQQQQRHHQQASVAAPSQRPLSSGQNHAHHHHQNQNHHLHGLQTQQTSQSINNQNNPGAADIARRAEATQASLAAASGQAYRCPDPFGYFRHHKSCDKYWACDNSTGTLKVCGNGLNFDDSDPKRENCAYPFSVDCGDRVELEPPISTPHCPRLYGLFPDPTNCRVFFSCWNGESSRYECPPGLAYDNEQRVCVWADLVDRCDQSEVSDGFVCPDATEVDQPGHYTRHAHPTDCRKFYVCIEGVARPYGCSLGTVFNVDSLQCDEPDNVSGCEKYYGDMDPKVAKKLARENTQGNVQQSQQVKPATSSSSFSQSQSHSSSSSSSSSGGGNSAGRQSSSSQANSNH